ADRVEREALARIAPPAELWTRVRAATARLTERAASAAARRGSPVVRCVVAGSAARGTFLFDRLDIDLFLLFPPTLGRSDLEREGIALARDLLEQPEMRYAEHPYLRGRFEGFAVDAVPGYAIEDPSKPLSAVDRTPFHQEYVARRLTDRLIGEIRLAKQFARTLGIYGSEARTGGCSGYLVELLVLRFGSFRGLLEAARGWSIPVRLPTDPTARPRVPDDVALILDDPVDPHRNVATALSRRNLALLVLGADEYLRRPGREAFEPAPPPVVRLEEAIRAVEARGTHVAFVAMARPPLVDDVLFPQLRKAERAIAEEAGRLGFRVLGSAAAAGPLVAVVGLETDRSEIPRVQVRDGPPAGLDRGASFLERWRSGEPTIVQGPYVAEDGRLRVETRREEVRLEPLLDHALPELSVGKDLRTVLVPPVRFRPLSEAEPTEELAIALGGLLGKRLPWRRPPTGP
ncbi:MAG TPA: CCA tRNA nucleotidyltransferase, partial [Thermoplasmata archaeon]|nr:CCA tRNA nucleotidyltransferase [Thermoplasmata archaeon]